MPREIDRERLVLVVEDHPDTQSAVAEHLAESGFEVAVASDGLAALEFVRERHPQVVYLDLNLPHISGYDVCEQIRADPALADIVIVMTSARGSLDVRAHALEAGADAYVPKPYSLERLLAQVNDLALRDR